MAWQEIAKNVAPVLAGFLPPPFNGLATAAVKVALGLSEDASEKEIEKAIATATPEQIKALKDAENDFKVKMAELGIDLEEIAAQDRKDARELAKSTGLETVNNLAIFNIIFLLFVIGGTGILIGFDLVDTDNGVLVSLLTLAVREAFARNDQINNFFFGSSAGSRQKSDLLALKNSTYSKNP